MQGVDAGVEERDLAVPVGVTFPKTWSQPILGSAHW